MTETAAETGALRSFGLVMAGAVTLLFGLGFPWLGGRPYPVWPWAVAAVLVAWALVWPAGLAPAHRAWMAAAHVLGWLNTRLILGLVFFVVLTPIGLVMRLAGRDPMHRRFEPGLATYRVPRARPPEPSDLERPF